MASATNESSLIERAHGGIEALFSAKAHVLLLSAEDGSSQSCSLAADGNEPGTFDRLGALLGATASGETEPLLWAKIADGGLFGLLTVERDAPANFDADEKEMFLGVTTQLALAIKRLRSCEKAEERLRRDLELARQIQRRFLQLPKSWPGLRMESVYRPAFHVGGDFYDVVAREDGRIMAVIGDVSGNGVAAALLMARVSSEFRRLAQVAEGPAALLGKLNDLLGAESLDNTFVTATCLELDIERGHLWVANAGHVEPIIRRPSGEIQMIGKASGPPLGILTLGAYKEECHPIHTGDMLLLMTDGVVESIESDPIEMRSLARLIGNAPHDLKSISERILAELERAQANGHADDVTLLAIELTEDVHSMPVSKASHPQAA